MENTRAKSGEDILTRTPCRALLFDPDGVLIDSTPAVARVWRRWAFVYAVQARANAGTT